MLVIAVSFLIIKKKEKKEKSPTTALQNGLTTEQEGQRCISAHSSLND